MKQRITLKIKSCDTVVRTYTTPLTEQNKQDLINLLAQGELLVKSFKIIFDNIAEIMRGTNYTPDDVTSIVNDDSWGGNDFYMYHEDTIIVRVEVLPTNSAKKYLLPIRDTAVGAKYELTHKDNNHFNYLNKEKTWVFRYKLFHYLPYLKYNKYLDVVDK